MLKKLIKQIPILLLSTSLCLAQSNVGEDWTNSSKNRSTSGTLASGNQTITGNSTISGNLDISGNTVYNSGETNSQDTNIVTKLSKQVIANTDSDSLENIVSDIGAVDITRLMICSDVVFSEGTAATITANITLDFTCGGTIDGTAGGVAETIAVNGPIIAAPYRQIFGVSVTPTYGANVVLYWPQWIGGSAPVVLTTPLGVASGGTGLATITDGGVMLGSGTGAITPMAVLAAGEIIVGDGTTDPIALGAGATTEVLVGGGAASPVWTTATGTGAPVRENTPTLITPVLGAATGISIVLTSTIKSTANEGTEGYGTITTTEYGDGYNHVTVLTLTDVVLPAISGAVNEAQGVLLYTFPAGVQVIDSVYMSVSIQGLAGIQADTPDVGIGSVIATGVVATLNGTATFEDYVTGQTAADCNGTETVKTTLPTDGDSTILESGDTKTLHFNFADGWAAASATNTADGTVTIKWTTLN